MKSINYIVILTAKFDTIIFRIVKVEFLRDCKFNFNKKFI